METEFIISNGIPGDGPRVAAAISTTIASIPYYNDLAKASEIDKYKADDIEAKISEETHSVIVARMGDEIVGFCLTKFDDNLIWIEWFGVACEYRGSGIAGQLLDAMEATVKERKCHKVWCDTRTSNRESAHILTKRGYKKIATISNHWYGQDFILWEKPID